MASSYGVIVAMEVMRKLCSENRRGKAVLIDGSIEYAKSLKSLYLGGMTDYNDIQVKVISDVLTSFQPSLVTNTVSRRYFMVQFIKVSNVFKGDEILSQQSEHLEFYKR